MKVSALSSALFVLAATAAPAPVAVPQSLPQICLTPLLTQTEAELIVQRYSDVIAQRPSDLGSAARTAALIVDGSYTEQSDSANIQIGKPLGALTTPSKQAFITASQADPPLVATTLGVFLAGCNNILWQWRATQFGDRQYEVQGFHLFELDDFQLLHKTYFEFNSIAGALDIGFKVLEPNGTPLGPGNV